MVRLHEWKCSYDAEFCKSVQCWQSVWTCLYLFSKNLFDSRKQKNQFSSHRSKTVILSFWQKKEKKKMSEVYLLVAFVFLAVAGVRLLMSICSSIRKKNEARHKNQQVTRQQATTTPCRQHSSSNYRRDLDVFVIDIGPSSDSDFDMWDEQPPPTYEDAVRLSSPSSLKVNPRCSCDSRLSDIH